MLAPVKQTDSVWLRSSDWKSGAAPQAMNKEADSGAFLTLAPWLINPPLFSQTGIVADVILSSEVDAAILKIQIHTSEISSRCITNCLSKPHFCEQRDEQLPQPDIKKGSVALCEPNSIDNASHLNANEGLTYWTETTP